MDERRFKIMLACGGTGGHLFPGIAIAEEIAGLHPDASIVFAGTERGIESAIIPKLGWPMISVKAMSIKDRTGIGRIAAYAKLPFSVICAFGVLRRERPGIIIGIGGYAAGPLMLAAAFLKIPAAIVEPNAIAGFTNRILGRFVSRVYTGFPEAAEFFPRKKVVCTGNPVRKEIIALVNRMNEGRRTRDEGRGTLRLRSGQAWDEGRATRDVGRTTNDERRTTVFCFGGSQGALALNRAVVQALPHLSDQREKFRFIHQVGEKEDIEKIKNAYAQNGFEAEVFKFTDRIWESYEKADFVICRAGATMVAELCVLGLPAIFIPYPHAADDHQRANAESLVRRNGAVIILQQDLTGERLGREIKRMNSERLAAMSAASARAGKRDAAKRIVDDCLKLINHKDTKKNIMKNFNHKDTKDTKKDRNHSSFCYFSLSLCSLCLSG